MSSMLLPKKFLKEIRLQSAFWTPAARCVDAAIAIENNLSETAFTVKEGELTASLVYAGR